MRRGLRSGAWTVCVTLGRSLSSLGLSMCHSSLGSPILGRAAVALCFLSPSIEVLYSSQPLEEPAVL